MVKGICMSDRIHYCPHCKTALCVPLEYWGTLMTCEECSNTFTPDESNVQPATGYPPTTSIKRSPLLVAVDHISTSPSKGWPLNGLLTKRDKSFALIILGVVTLAGFFLLGREKSRPYDSRAYERETDRLTMELDRERTAIRTNEDLDRSYQRTQDALAAAYRDSAEAEAEIRQANRDAAVRKQRRTLLLCVAGLIALLILLIKPALRRVERVEN